MLLLFLLLFFLSIVFHLKDSDRPKKTSMYIFSDVSVRLFTCDMLRLHGACLHQERLSALERQDGLADQPALSLRLVPAVVQLDDLLEVSRLSVG